MTPKNGTTQSCKREFEMNSYRHRSVPDGSWHTSITRWISYLAFGSAPFLSKRFVMSTCPSWAAKWSGVNPAFDSASVFAPYSRREAAISSWFFLAVM